MATRNVPLASAGPRVGDVMLSEPRTVAPSITVGEARERFANPRVRLLLVARGATYLGSLTRESLPADAADDAPVEPLVDAGGERLTPADPVARAVALLDARDADRIPVVAEDGEIVGLVCFNRKHGHFCVDG